MAVKKNYSVVRKALGMKQRAVPKQKKSKPTKRKKW
jgi:hypothetical protein